MKKKYRVVKDSSSQFSLLYRVQAKVWWWPFWSYTNLDNIFSSLEDAITYIKRLKQDGEILYEE